MARVRALKVIASPWGTGMPGTVIDCPDAIAKAWVAAGAAEYVEHPTRAAVEVEAAVIEPQAEEARVVVEPKPKRRPRRKVAKPKTRRK